MNANKPKILVLGAGYAGMMTTKRLSQQLRPDEADITLVNKHNYHYLTTWLHEVAAGTATPNSSRVMISDVINTKRVQLHFDSVVKINKDEKRVLLENGELSYDYLVIALGFETATFGIPGIKEHALKIENINSSRHIRDHIEFQFARYSSGAEKSEDALTILVGGAGFTGIEFVGELAKRVPELCIEYNIEREKVRIINVEAAPAILPGFEDDLVEYAQKSLEERGIEFRIGAKIQECTEEGFIIGDDHEVIKAGTVVWTGGVQASPVVKDSGFELVKGKVNVDHDLRVPGHDHIFIIGDCSWVMDKENDRPYPANAQSAIQEAETCASNVKALLRNEELQDFAFDYKGTVASLGGSDAMGTILDDKKLYGIKAKAMKNIIDDRYLYLVGGPKLVLKKGKVKLT
ncbi:NAD(P)/FAD-dependent oxidoreductase [Halobacillus sp. A5]|uniref:NAD(P)/FAD-dependent oxidoreductase n=1 Tax=Halobacillus sp. A5 TaxID=2880263 RepID=UPI0020A69467|nr:NAD(P)/FAD-dependent oxidoreductase [Halobacillus sp. A5]MCP3027272.1 NAD(P)/FAD-dependent oxidoreductase [Halobacillus sp. A5]